MSDLATVQVIDGEPYVHIREFCEHLKVCADSVDAFCDQDNPVARAVSMTLEQTRDNLLTMWARHV